MKGYRRIYGRSQKDLLGYYENMGWKRLEGSPEFFFSDHAYIEIVFDTEPHPNAVRLGADPYVLMRPEGRWDRPGILDRSAQRSSGKCGPLMRNVIDLRFRANNADPVPTLVLLDLQQEYVAPPRLFAISGGC